MWVLAKAAPKVKKLWGLSPYCPLSFLVTTVQMTLHEQVTKHVLTHLLVFLEQLLHRVSPPYGKEAPAMLFNIGATDI